MSKIEKALNRAQSERGSLQLVPVSGTTEMAPTGTALIADRVAHPETIARMASSEKRLLSPSDLAAHGFIHKNIVDDASVQVFRELRTKILQQTGGRNCVILVSGVRSGNGSSFVAKNLAAAFAFDMVRTALVIDCNFKNPSFHRLTGTSSPKGLLDYLEESNIGVAEIIHAVGIPRFRVIPAGLRKRTEVEHFSSGKMRQLMDSVRMRYTERLIILDGPPMSDLADIRTLSQFADYVLIVARYGRATHAQIESCVNAIGNSKLLGIVFNDEPRIPWMR